MADLTIDALPAGSGNMLSTDRIPVAKFGTPYVTVYRTGQEIMNAITSLSTASFTNINTSINNAITTATNNANTYSSQLDGVIGRDFFLGGSFNSGSSHVIKGNIDLATLGSVQADRVYSIKVRIYAYRVSGGCAVRVKEYMITVATDSSLGAPGVQIIGGGGNADHLFDHYDTDGANITLNPSGFSINSSGKLRYSVSHGIAGQFVSFLGYYKMIL